MPDEPDWRRLNRANWDESVPVHLGPGSNYDFRAPRREQAAFEPRDYADPSAQLENATTHQFLHPLGEVVTALIEAGLRLDWLHEHDGLVWRMFACQVEDEAGLFRWPDKPWLPLSYSLRATRPAGTMGNNAP